MESNRREKSRLFLFPRIHICPTYGNRTVLCSTHKRPYEHLNKDGDLKQWFHVPDVLVFRQRSVPHLYQIKNSPDIETEIFKLCNSRCEKLAFSQNWKYSVIYPKTLPEAVVRNLKFLNPYLKKRKSYSQWVDQVINKLSLALH